MIKNLYLTDQNPVYGDESTTKIIELYTEDSLSFNKNYMKVAEDSTGESWYARISDNKVNDFDIPSYYKRLTGNTYWFTEGKDEDGLVTKESVNMTGNNAVTSQLLYYEKPEYSHTDNALVYIDGTNSNYTVNYVLGSGVADDPQNYEDYSEAAHAVGSYTVGNGKTLVGNMDMGVPQWLSGYLSKGGNGNSSWSTAGITLYLEREKYKPQKNQTLREIYPDVPSDIGYVPDVLDLSEYDSLQDFFVDYSTSSDIIYDVRGFVDPNNDGYLHLDSDNEPRGYIISNYEMVKVSGSIMTNIYDKRPELEMTESLPYSLYEYRVKYRATNKSPYGGPTQFYSLTDLERATISNQVTDSLIKYLYYNYGAYKSGIYEFNFPGTGTLYRINGYRDEMFRVLSVPNPQSTLINNSYPNWDVTYGVYAEKQFPSRFTIYNNEYTSGHKKSFEWCFHSGFTLQGLLDEIDSYVGSPQEYASFDSFLQGYDFIEDPDMNQVFYDKDFNYGSHTFEKESSFDSSISPSNLSSVLFRTADGAFSLSTVLVNNDGLSLRAHYSSDQPDSLFQRTVTETTPFGSHTFLQLVGVSIDDETGNEYSQLGSVYRSGSGKTGDTIDTLIFGDTQGTSYYNNMESYSLTRIYGSHTYLGVNCALVEWPEEIDFEDGWRNFLYDSTYTESQTGLNKFYFYIPESYSGKTINFSIPGFSQINLVGPDIDISHFTGYTEYRTYRDGNIVTLTPNS